ncbi:MAG: hypothetical protein HZC18_03460 [Candidatus Omnitrophica bacterium]|nr:hypothetical protein [Candidatus Omnitrophota bacterium]
MSLKNFHYIEEKDIIRIFKDPRKENKIDKNDQVARKKELNRSLHERICSFPELKAKIASSPLIRSKSELKITGIPQGTSISGMLANIFMIDFDLAIKKELEAIGGFYRRYSDDILVAFPNSVTFAQVEAIIENALRKYSADCLKINGGKTNRGVYIEKDNGVGVCYDAKGKLSPIQYLGFVFHGEKTHIRSSSMARNRSKIVNTIKKYKKGRSGQAKLGSINTRKVYQLQSPRKITPQDSYENKGFASYAKRAGNLQNAPEINKQIRKSDRFIRKKIAEERKPRYLRQS